jgi:Phage T7 tail fibre protein/Domain of unknown function (DUF1983)
MADSYVLITASAGEQTFTVPFPFILRDHVHISLNGVEQLSPADFVWITDGALKLSGPLIANGVTVKLWRETDPDGVLVAFNNGAVLTAADLNTATLQALYRTQELQDQLDSYVTGGVGRYQVNGLVDGLTPEQLIAQVAADVLDSELATDLLGAITDIATNAATLLTHDTRITTLQTTVDALASVSGTGIATLISNEQTSRIAGDSALAGTIASIGAVDAGTGAFILDAANVYVDGSTSIADKFTGILSTTSAAITAAVAAETSARTTADSSLASSLAALTATVAGNTASISTEATARATADSAAASTVTALSTTVAGNTAAIATNATTVNGLSAQYTVKVDVNGHVAGYGLASQPINGTTVSSFIVTANKFAIIDPGNGVSSPKVPFSVVAGVVYMDQVVIKDALIQNMTITKLTQGSLNADMNIGTGRIIWDNGAYMKVTGVGFGSSSQFLEWFGPHFSNFNSCTEANAIQYLKTNGDAYFGGTLLSGILSNATQATVLAVGNVCDLGPFSSNGGPITINWSYNFHAQTNFPGTSAGLSAFNGASGNTPSAQLILSRSINGGSFADVQTINITNGTAVDVAPIVADSEPGHHAEIMSGSGTYTDPSHLAQNREYKLRINSWSIGATVTSNVLGLHSTE